MSCRQSALCEACWLCSTACRICDVCVILNSFCIVWAANSCFAAFVRWEDHGRCLMRTGGEPPKTGQKSARAGNRNPFFSSRRRPGARGPTPRGGTDRGKGATPRGGTAKPKGRRVEGKYSTSELRAQPQDHERWARPN